MISHSPFDDSLETADAHLNSEEKSHIWEQISAHMEMHPAAGQEVELQDVDIRQFFAGACEEVLSSEEKAECFAFLLEEKEAQQFFALAQLEALGLLEKQSILSSLQAAASASASSMEEQVPTVEIASATRALRWLVPGFAAFILLVGSGAGISYASEGSLPGEFLYTLKQFNERMLTGFQMSNESKATVQADHLRRRIEEAQALNEKSRLTEGVSLSIDTEFRRERREALQHVQDLENEGNAEAAARIKARLNAYEDRIQKLLRGRPRDDSDSASSSIMEDTQTSLSGGLQQTSSSSSLSSSSSQISLPSSSSSVSSLSSSSSAENTAGLGVKDALTKLSGRSGSSSSTLPLNL